MIHSFKLVTYFYFSYEIIVYVIYNRELIHGLKLDALAEF